MPQTYDDTLPYRIAFGLTFFAALAAWEVARNGRRSARLREYGFLLLATTIAIAFAVAHDQIAATISPEYFLTGKGLASDPRPFRLAVAGAPTAGALTESNRPRLVTHVVAFVHASML